MGIIGPPLPRLYRLRLGNAAHNGKIRLTVTKAKQTLFLSRANRESKFRARHVMTGMVALPVHLGPYSLSVCSTRFLVRLPVTASSLKVTSWPKMGVNSYSRYQHKEGKGGKKFNPPTFLVLPQNSAPFGHVFHMAEGYGELPSTQLRGG